jgi:AcrR family transcriptional regulator
MFAHGVTRTSLDDVKAAAGVSSSQLYHYFEDKQALVSAVIEYQTEAVLADQQPLLAGLDSVAAFRAWRDVLVGFRRASRCRGGCPIGSLGSELADTDAHARRELAGGFRRWETSIANGLREMRARGELVPDADPDDLALAVLAAAQGGILLAQIHRETRPLETALDTIIDHIESLVVPPRRPRKVPRPA